MQKNTGIFTGKIRNKRGKLDENNRLSNVSIEKVLVKYFNVQL